MLRAFADVVRHYSIPLRYPLDFLEAMRSDLYQTRYPNLEALRGYMWGSAAVVGVMMCYLMRRTAPAVLEHAALMGYAMQMTNFLRDIGEDWQRGRVYLPQDELRAYGVTEAHLAQGIVDEKFCYDLFRHRAHTSSSEKMRIAVCTFVEWRRGRWLSHSS